MAADLRGITLIEGQLLFESGEFDYLSSYQLQIPNATGIYLLQIMVEDQVRQFRIVEL
ncbi:MAG: hypothetical protein GQ574_03925 [Crocinitomix sp.]|nr:hypothetical protein [Crocinitomix sp.]